MAKALMFGIDLANQAQVFATSFSWWYRAE
jgi:hypothetical protein